jgi:anti-sigma factor RsiW
VIGHLGPRVSALLDGQLSPEESERAWAHVHACHSCRDQVEREGWVKTRLAGLSHASGSAPAHLKGSLLGGPHALPPGHPGPPGDAYVTMGPPHPHRLRRNTGLVAIGGGAVGAAVMGVLALGVAPADAPTDRRAPVTHLVRPSDAPRVVTPTLTPAPGPGRGDRTR